MKIIRQGIPPTCFPGLMLCSKQKWVCWQDESVALKHHKPLEEYWQYLTFCWGCRDQGNQPLFPTLMFCVFLFYQLTLEKSTVTLFALTTFQCSGTLTHCSDLSQISCMLFYFSVKCFDTIQYFYFCLNHLSNIWS